MILCLYWSIILLLSQALLYKEGCVSLHAEDNADYEQTNKQTHALLNMLISLLAKFSQYRPLADAIEKFLKFSHDVSLLSVIIQFGFEIRNHLKSLILGS